MPDYTISTQSELLPPNTSLKKKRHHWMVFLEVLLLVIMSLAILGSASLIYIYNRYEPFYVNGDSMYPTLNSNATRPSGGQNDGTWGGFGVGYTCDYGFMDDHNNTIASLKRFDVLVVYFPSDFTGGVLNSAADLKIKRLIALPGETVYFDANGLLHIKKQGENTFASIVQPDGINSVSTSARGSFATSSSAPCLLGDDQYFVCGDNRAPNASEDSRFVGPLSKTYIRGKAVSINATCTITASKNCSLNFFSFKMPWAVQYL